MSDRERQILYDLTYTWNLRTPPTTKTVLKDTKNRLTVLVVVGGRGVGEMSEGGQR